MNGHCETTPEDIATPSGATKRPRNREKWARVTAKKRRNLGKEYVSRKTHKTMQARKVGS